MNNKIDEKEKKSITQLEIAREIANQLGTTVTLVEKIIELEQKLTMEYISKGYKVTKKNYLTLYSIQSKPRKLKCPINNKEYNIKEYRQIKVRIGEGFKKYLNKKPMDDRLCRLTTDNNSIKK